MHSQQMSCVGVCGEKMNCVGIYGLQMSCVGVYGKKVNVDMLKVRDGCKYNQRRPHVHALRYI